MRKLNNHDDVLEAIAREIDIPEHLDEIARNRYRSLGEWLDREKSSIKDLNPQVSPQGSFLLGTVIKPLGDTDEYDVDLVCSIDGSKQASSMQELKLTVGAEIKAYAKAQNMKHEPEDKRRCWTMEYADEANFHMDILPAFPDAEALSEHLARMGSAALMETPELFGSAIAITDKTHPSYGSICFDWPVSNPGGFARWFYERQREALRDAKEAKLRSERAYASVDDIPDHKVKTPLQRAIQLLKRHRDSMFADDSEHKPISIILTTLSAKAYQGERTISETLRTVLRDMDRHVERRADGSWVENPSNPAENFADKWNEEAQKEQNFRDWLTAAQRDFGTYIRENRYSQIPPALSAAFSEPTMRRIRPALPVAIPAVVASGASQAEAEAIRNSGAATKPWFDES